MRFSEQLRQAAAEVWEAQHQHPFVRGIAGGTLDPKRFRVYVRQDYLFLIEYGRLLALACARAPRLELMERFASSRNRRCARRWTSTAPTPRSGESQAKSSNGSAHKRQPVPTRTSCCGRCSRRLRRASGLLPCMWGYSELGQRLARDQRPGEQRYARWIDMYSSEEFAKRAQWCRELCDQAAADAGEEAKRRMQDAFITSSRYQLDFWESAWHCTA
jgi:thiaminase/transcriptional activator TenA